VEAGKRLLAALPEQARRELGREFERDFGREVRRELGMSPQQLVELLAAFGPEVAIAVDPPQVAPPFLTVSAFIQVRDPQRAEAAVRQLLARDARQAVQFEESDGIKTWSTELRVEGARVTPTVGLREGWLVFSNFKSVAKRLLATGPLGEKALAADPRFTAAAKAHAGSALFVTGRLEPLIDAY